MRIEGQTAKASSLLNQRSRLHLLPLYEGLSDEEWAVWRVQEPYAHLFAASAGDPELRASVKYLTGLIPLVLSTLASYKTDDFEKAMHAYANDNDPQSCGGSWVREQLCNHTDSIAADRPLRYSDFVDMMLYAVTETRAPDHFDSAYDHRFYKYTKPTPDSLNTLTPINGFIAKTMIDVLAESKDEQLRDAFYDIFNNRSWVCTGLDSANPIIKNYAYGLYVINQVRKEYEIPYECVCRFSGDFPSPDVLDDRRVVLYWPLKWNLRYVDCVVRECVEGYVQKKRKRGRWCRGLAGTIPPSVTIHAIRATLQRPLDNASALKFYTTKHSSGSGSGDGDDVPDCDRYVRLDTDPEQRVHNFHWYVPGTLLVPPDTVADTDEHKPEGGPQVGNREHQTIHLVST